MTEGDKVILTVKPQYGFGDKGNPAHGVPPNAMLKITLELLSWNQVPFLKTILKEGEGDKCPNETALVRCKSFIHSLFLLDLLLHVFSCDISLSCIFLVKLIGKMQDGTVFLTESHSDDDRGKLLIFFYLFVIVNILA